VVSLTAGEVTIKLLVNPYNKQPEVQPNKQARYTIALLPPAAPPTNPTKPHPLTGLLQELVPVFLRGILLACLDGNFSLVLGLK